MIDVIIPVYRGLQETQRCLDSVLASSCETAREIIVIDDASPEPGMRDYLGALAQAQAITLRSNPVNLGYVGSVNAGMALHPDRDVLLLNSDTEVADGWLDRIAACATRDPRSGTVTPFSNNATICSFPDFAARNELPRGMTTRTLDRLFARVNAGLALEIPTAVGFCMWISRDCLAAVGFFDEAAFGRGYGEEVDFCMRASRRGFHHWLCADTFVYHAGEVSFGTSGADRRRDAQRTVDERYPEFQIAVRDFIARDPAAPLRERVLRELALGERHALPDAACRSGPLVVIIAPDGLRSGVEATQDTAALEQTLHGVVVQSALPDLEVCVVTEASRVDPARVVLQRIAPAGAVVRASSIVPVAPGLSFAATLRSLIAEHPGRDVALIAPGALLPFAWDARLSKAVEAGPDIAAAIPMCDTSPLFALVDERFRGDPRAEAARIDRSAYCLGDRVYYEVPALHPVCVWLRRDMLESALPRVLSPSPDPQPALDELARWWRATGACCVICDYLYVGLAGATAPQPAPGDLDATAYLRDHPLGGLRRAVNDAIERGLAPASIPGLDHRPVQLHIMHFWGGGTETWVRDFGRADASRVNMILATYRIGETGGQRVVLYSDPDASIPVRTFDIARPIRSTAVGSIEYRRILVQIIAEFNIEAIIVSSLIGHTLDVLRQPVKTLIVCHDFYPVCQAINPLFGTTCVRCTQDDLRRCARSNPLNNFFDDQTPDEWHAMREIYVSLLLERSIPIVVPSPSVAATLRSISPRLLTVPMHVVPHGIDLAVPRIEPAQRSADEPLRIVVLGRMSERKGSKLLHAAAEGLRGLAEITLVGCGEGGLALARDCGWPSIERYEPDALPGLLRDIAPHAGLLASIIPESFSYTLSELSALGIPPLVTALGSFRDRVVDGENGFLFEPDKSALVALVRRLHAQPELLAGVARRLAALPRGRTTAQMIDDYHALLPLAPQPIARFHLGIGRQTGLSEPYRHLTEAYAALTEAYTQTRAAYSELTGVLTHPWRIGKALRLFAALGAAFREKIGMHGRAPPRIGGRGK